MSLVAFFSVSQRALAQTSECGSGHPSYDLELALAGRSLRGTERIAYEHSGEPSRSLALRIFANAGPTNRPTRQRVEVRNVVCEPRCTVESPSASAIVLRFDHTLAQGEHVRISAELDGTLDFTAPEANGGTAMLEAAMNAMTGDGGGDYGLFAEANGISMMTGFFPVVAARSNGEWVLEERSSLGDIVTDRLGHVRATLDVPSGTTVVATGNESREAPARVRIDAPCVRDFAVLASDRFVSSERTVNGVRIRSYFVREHREGGERVLDYAAESFAVFAQHFGDYPWSELDLVEAGVGGGAGGVEFSGLATVGSTFYAPGGVMGGLAQSLGLPAELSPMITAMTSGMTGGADPLAGALEFITAHEVAHQWWHGLVGSSSREHAFLDESLAQWSARLYLEKRYGRERAERETASQITQNYRTMRMMGQPDGRVDRATDSFETPIAYAGLVYGKGAHFFERVRRLVGDEAFFTSLRRYVQRHRFGLATPNALLDAFGRDRARAETLYRRWFEGTHGDQDLGAPAGGGVNGDPNELLRMLQGLSP